MIIKYGTTNNTIDVTDICLSKLKLNNKTVIIPAGDLNRAYYFSDPVTGHLKKIIITNNENETTEYDHNLMIKIDLVEISITTLSDIDIETKLVEIQNKLVLNHGKFYDEYPEQRISVRYLTGDEKVLEIGGNIGRNSLIISSILKDSSNLLVLECNKEIVEQLEENKVLNGFNFNIEKSALSKKKLIQKDWFTKVSDTLEDGYNFVNTITLNELNKKYKLQFDTLVLDCEGSFYYILLDFPEILENVNLIIMENDYTNVSDKEYVDKVLIENNFYRNYVECGGFQPFFNNFYEVWIK